MTENEELNDVVNDNDEVIDVKTRKYVWENGLEHNVRVINVFIFNSKGELLLPKRSKNKSFMPGTYDSSCGENLIHGESYTDAAVRGLREELNLEGLELIEIGKLTPKDGINCFATNYKVIADISLPKFNPKEVESIAWVDFEKVKRDIKEKPELFKRDIPKTIELLLS